MKSTEDKTCLEQHLIARLAFRLKIKQAPCLNRNSEPRLDTCSEQRLRARLVTKPFDVNHEEPIALKQTLPHLSIVDS